MADRCRLVNQLLIKTETAWTEEMDLQEIESKIAELTRLKLEAAGNYPSFWLSK